MLEMMQDTEDSGPQIIFLKCRLLSLTFPAQRRKGQPLRSGLPAPVQQGRPWSWRLPSHRHCPPAAPSRLSPGGICPRPPSCSHLQAFFGPGSPGLFLSSSSLPVSPTLGSLITRKGPFRAQPAAHLLWPEVLPQPASPTAFLEHLRPGRPCPPLLACPVQCSPFCLSSLAGPLASVLLVPAGDQSPPIFICCSLFPCSVLFLQFSFLSWDDIWPPSLQPWGLTPTSPLPAPSECLTPPPPTVL